MELRVIERGELPVDQRRKRCRQVFLLRHRRALDEHRYNRDAAAQSGLDLQTNEVAGIVESAGTVGSAQRRPSWSDHDEHRGGLSQRGLQYLDEVGARVEGLD